MNWAIPVLEFFTFFGVTYSSINICSLPGYAFYMWRPNSRHYHQSSCHSFSYDHWSLDWMSPGEGESSWIGPVAQLNEKSVSGLKFYIDIYRSVKMSFWNTQDLHVVLMFICCRCGFVVDRANKEWNDRMLFLCILNMVCEYFFHNLKSLPLLNMKNVFYIQPVFLHNLSFCSLKLLLQLFKEMSLCHYFCVLIPARCLQIKEKLVMQLLSMMLWMCRRSLHSFRSMGTNCVEMKWCIMDTQVVR